MEKGQESKQKRKTPLTTIAISQEYAKKLDEYLNGTGITRKEFVELSVDYFQRTGFDLRGEAFDLSPLEKVAGRLEQSAKIMERHNEGTEAVHLLLQAVREQTAKQLPAPELIAHAAEEKAKGQVMARYRLANPNNPKDGIMLDHQIRLTNFTFGSFTLVGATMTYDGHLVVAAQNGLLVLNRALTTIEDSYPLPSDQILTNSICIDENGGVYVASNSRTPGGKGLMQKLICKDGKISTSQADGAWQAYYDGGPQAPCIKLGHGTGSTPTLMGFGQDKDKLVVITDGSKRMKLVAFWRDEIPSDAQQVAGYDKRIAGVHEVTCGLGTSTEWIQSEQSVVVGGYDAFVVNNINVTNQEINDKIIGVIAIGPIVKGPQGAECVRWNTKEKKWESKWTRSDVSSVSMIPAVSIKSEMVFVCGWNDASGWEVTGLDWKSGATRHRSILGKNNRANGAYAIIQYLANGDLLFNSVAGPIRVKY